MARIPGAATPESTAEFARRSVEAGHAVAAHFRRAPDGTTLSSLGLGTYLGRPDAATDRAVEEAVAIVLTSGRMNVIDTAINYRLQRAERSIGRALARLVERGRVARSEVFVATKVGYLAPDGESPLAPADWVRTELIDRGRLRPEEIVDGSHAMSPAYLRDQVGRSRDNLGLETLDLVYLHNAPDAQLAAVGPERFRERLRAAFEELERLRSEGVLRTYGLATWDALRRTPGDDDHWGLAATVAIARAVGGADHGFRYVQLPFNRSMPEAAAWPTQPTADGSVLPVFGAARAWGLGVFTNVPILQGRLVVPGRVDGLRGAQPALQFARSAPGALTALVGAKRPEHLSEDLELAERAPWDGATFRGQVPPAA